MIEKLNNDWWIYHGGHDFRDLIFKINEIIEHLNELERPSQFKPPLAILLNAVGKEYDAKP